MAQWPSMFRSRICKSFKCSLHTLLTAIGAISLRAVCVTAQGTLPVHWFMCESRRALKDYVLRCVVCNSRSVTIGTVCGHTRCARCHSYCRQHKSICRCTACKCGRLLLLYLVFNPKLHVLHMIFPNALFLVFSWHLLYRDFIVKLSLDIMKCIFRNISSGP